MRRDVKLLLLTTAVVAAAAMASGCEVTLNPDLCGDLGGKYSGLTCVYTNFLAAGLALVALLLGGAAAVAGAG